MKLRRNCEEVLKRSAENSWNFQNWKTAVDVFELWNDFGEVLWMSTNPLKLLNFLSYFWYLKLINGSNSFKLQFLFFEKFKIKNYSFFFIYLQICCCFCCSVLQFISFLYFFCLLFEGIENQTKTKVIKESVRKVRLKKIQTIFEKIFIKFLSYSNSTFNWYLSMLILLLLFLVSDDKIR